MPRNKPRPIDSDIRYRNMLEAQGRPAMAGLSRVGFGGGAATAIVSTSTTTVTQEFYAQLLVLTATGATVDSGGDYLTFDTVAEQVGFDGVPVSVGDAWTHPITGVYQIDYTHAWDTYEGGGTVQLEVDDALVSYGTIASGSVGQKGSGTLTYFAQQGEVGRIKVTQSSGSGQDCDATLHIAVTDPAQKPLVADAPTTVVSRTSSDSTDPASFSMTAPSGISIGDTMVACVSAGGYAGGGGTYTLTVDPAWTPVYEDDGTDQILSNIYTKTADAADAANTSSYTFSFATTGGLPGLNVVLLGWAPQYGTILDASNVDHTATPSVASPGGDWQLAFVTQRTSSAFGQPTPDPVVDSDATLLVSAVVSAQAGSSRVYASDDVEPVTGDFLTGGIDFARYGLVVVAVSR